MKRRYWVLVIIMAVVLVGSYAVYALDYRGNYNLDVNFEFATGATPSAVQILSLNVTQEPTEYVDFWDILKHITPASKGLVGTYVVTMTVTVGGQMYEEVDGFNQEINSMEHISFKIPNVKAGTGKLTVVVEQKLAITGVNVELLTIDKSFVVGGGGSWL